VWLTVLVLDAIELARGGSQLTIRKTPSTDAPLVFVAYQHVDAKWLEALKKHLGALIHSERIEFFSTIARSAVAKRATRPFAKN
jgi:hypothetical protein